MTKELTLIQIPFALGSHRRGSDLGPRAIEYTGIEEILASKGYKLNKEEVEVVIEKNDDIQTERLKNLLSVSSTAMSSFKTVDGEIKKGRFPIILGGDHSISIGTVSAVSKNYDNLGVIWVDAHGDVNTEETTPSGNIHGMPLAVSMNYGSNVLTHVFKYNCSPFIKPENVVIMGARDLDEGEIKFLKSHNITYYTMEDIHELSLEIVLKEIKEKFTCNEVDGIHVSFDMDVLDPEVVQGVGTPVDDGFSYKDAEKTLSTFKEWGKMVSLEVVETNPLLDVKNNTAKVATSLINEIF